MLQWLLRSKNRRPPELLPDDKRSAPRYRFNYRANVPLTVSIGVSSWPAMVRDLSSTGMCLVIGQRHEPGTCLPARLAHAERDLRHYVRLRVVHVVRRPDGYWTTGCVFEEPLPPGVFERLV